VVRITNIVIRHFLKLCVGGVMAQKPVNLRSIRKLTSFVDRPCQLCVQLHRSNYVFFQKSYFIKAYHFHIKKQALIETRGVKYTLQSHYK